MRHLQRQKLFLKRGKKNHTWPILTASCQHCSLYVLQKNFNKKGLPGVSLLWVLLQAQPMTSGLSSHPQATWAWRRARRPPRRGTWQRGLSGQRSRRSQLPKTNKSYIYFFFKRKEYPIFHVNIDNLLNKIPSFVIFLFFSSHVGVVLKYLKYVRYWKNKPKWLSSFSFFSLCFRDFCICGGCLSLADTSSGPRGDQGPSEVRSSGPGSKWRPSDDQGSMSKDQGLT